MLAHIDRQRDAWVASGPDIGTVLQAGTHPWMAAQCGKLCRGAASSCGDRFYFCNLDCAPSKITHALLKVWPPTAVLKPLRWAPIDITGRANMKNNCSKYCQYTTKRNLKPFKQSPVSNAQAPIMDCYRVQCLWTPSWAMTPCFWCILSLLVQLLECYTFCWPEPDPAWVLGQMRWHESQHALHGSQLPAWLFGLCVVAPLLCHLHWTFTVLPMTSAWTPVASSCAVSM